MEVFLSSNLQDGETALHKACFCGHDSVVKLLIDAHADIGISNKVSIKINGVRDCKNSNSAYGSIV